MMIRNEILEKIQAEGLAILKLHKKLCELNIEHDFIDRKSESIKIAKSKKEIEIINEMEPFNFQIIIKENGNKISLIQSSISYGITQNLIEVYNFQHEPIVFGYEIGSEILPELISKKKLNSFIINANEKCERLKELERRKNESE